MSRIPFKNKGKKTLTTCHLFPYFSQAPVHFPLEKGKITGERRESGGSMVK